MRNFSTRRTHLAAAALVGVAALSALAACGSDDSTATDPVESTSVTPTPTPTPTPTQTPSQSATTTTETTPSATASADTLITLSQPTDGQAVSTGSFNVEGTANSPEANVPWKLTNASGAVVASGAFTAEGWMDKLYPYSSSVDVKTLPAGAYTFTVAVDEESDGESKLPAQSVSVHLTVK
jgi:hypothetical protein